MERESGMADIPLTLEFFHDGLSAWCYKLSERLHAFVAAHPEVQVVHRSFPLASSPDFLGGRLFANKTEAKQEVIMVHWADARDFEPDPRINCELMMSRDFDYPYSMPNQLGGKAAEMQGGQAAHWAFFDRVQRAHLTECRNIADWEVLASCADEIGLDVSRWRTDASGEHAHTLVSEDMARAGRYGILRIPALVADGRHLLQGLPKSTLGYCIKEEGLETFYADVMRRRTLGYELL
jgi:predicted DsbA family dithiol-disulfide isomerase